MLDDVNILVKRRFAPFSHMKFIRDILCNVKKILIEFKIFKLITYRIV